ncbi:MAG: methylenetetrahydrofolate reductase [Propionibacteriaceae bacterium]|jgi:methylenetetrahydrofolate reductase (NADPH)|nr:methylenetetrahydrofolate reductase [Propionibacteriaceae bacterium]
MTIADLLAKADRPLVSFEFFPPKDQVGEEQLARTVDRLAPIRPDFVSVTYGANGSSRDRTLSASHRLVRQSGMRVMGHLTIASQSRTQIESVIDRYALDGVNHILAVRGDMPGGPTQPWQPHPDGLSTATELVELIARRGDFCIGIGAFPDAHPASHDPDLDAKIIKDKWQAGASFAITQLFFSVDAYRSLIERLRGLDCPIPVIAGIMPITIISQVERFAQLSGAVLPSALRQRLAAVADDPAAVRALGIATATAMAADLIDIGAPGLHFFTQNRSKATMEIWQRLEAQGLVQTAQGSLVDSSDSNHCQARSDAG